MNDTTVSNSGKYFLILMIPWYPQHPRQVPGIKLFSSIHFNTL